MTAEEEKQRVIPERLVTLIADRLWVKAVSKHSEARQVLLEAAIEFCRSEKAKASRASCRAYSKRAIESIGQDVCVP